MFFNFFAHTHVALFYSMLLCLVLINFSYAIILHTSLGLFWGYSFEFFLDFYWIMTLLMIYLSYSNSNNTLYFQPSFNWSRALKSHINNSLDFLKYVTNNYIYTINHNRIAINYLVFCMWSGLSGATLATMIRWELAYPGSHFFNGDSLSYLQVITTHGLTMVFFVVIPVVFGFFANFFIPYHIGSNDVAFPSLNSLGFWLLPAGYILISNPAFLRSSFFNYFDKPSFFYQILDNSSFNCAGGFSNSNLSHSGFLSWGSSNNINFPDYQEYSFTPLLFTKSLFNPIYAETLWRYSLGVLNVNRKKTHATNCPNSILTMSGWTFITPFSANTQYTGLGAQDISIIVVLLSGISTTISFTNLLITSSTLSMPGLRNSSVLIPFLTITLFLVMRMLVLITPVLGAAMIMLLMDSHFNTSFFDYAYGGDVILFQHLFWFFGHPEVYVVIIPAFGITNMVLPYYNTRRIASKHHLIWATYIMAYMGFLVWGHHMYLVGLDHRSRSMYSTITVMISLPAVVKLVNWTLTMLNGSLKVELPLLFTMSFFFFFLCGGLTGMWLSHVGLNVYVHDTFYVVAHFHFLFSAATFSAVFSALYYYFHVIFGINYSNIFGYLHLIYWTAGQWLTFLPLFWVGYNGLPRRYHDYPLFYLGWQGLSSIGHVLTIISGFFFFIMLLDSSIEQRIATNLTFGMPRFNNRVLYYIYNVTFLQYMDSQINLFSYNYSSKWKRSVEFEVYY